MQQTRRSFFSAFVALLASSPAWLTFPQSAAAGLSDQMAGRGDRRDPVLPAGAYINFDGDNREVTMTFERYDALANPRLTGLSWETLQFDVANRDLDWDSGPLGGWNTPGSHILGVALVWNYDTAHMGGVVLPGESVGPIIGVSDPSQFVGAMRKMAGFESEDHFWNYVLDQPWGKYTARVYYTTITTE